MTFSANNQRRRNEQAAKWAALSPAERKKREDERQELFLILSEAGKKTMADCHNRLLKLKTFESWTPEEKRIAEIWNTRPESPEHRQTLISELATLNEITGCGGLEEFISLLDASEVKKAS